MGVVGGTIRRSAQIATACLTLIGLLSGCSTGDSGARFSEYPPGSGIGMGLADAPAEESYSFDDVTLCLQSPGQVTVTDVELIEPTGGLSIVHWAIRPANTGSSMNYIEDPRTTLQEAGFSTSAPKVVDVVCPADDQPDDEPGNRSDDAGHGIYLLGIEVARTDPEMGTSRGVLVRYLSGQETVDHRVPFAMAICRDAPGEDGTLPEGCDVPHQIEVS